LSIELCASAAAIVLEGPTGFLGADEPTHIFVLAVIEKQHNRKLLTHRCDLQHERIPDWK
jgi:hypothetical protein